MKRFLLHPRITLAAVIAALGSLAGSCTAFVAALAPFLKIDFLKAFWPLITRIDGDLLTAGGFLLAMAGLLATLAGAGRSFISTVDQGPSK